MAQYPTAQEIRESLTADELAEEVINLPSYHTSPVNLVSLDFPVITPEILMAWAHLVAAVKDEYPTATATVAAITRPKTPEELESAAISTVQARVYARRQADEKANAK